MNKNDKKSFGNKYSVKTKIEYQHIIVNELRRSVKLNARLIWLNSTEQCEKIAKRKETARDIRTKRYMLRNTYSDVLLVLIPRRGTALLYR